MDKNNIYCHGCPLLKTILKEIHQKEVIKVFVPEEFMDKPKYQIGFYLGDICWSEQKFFSEHNYTEVTSQQFREAWLGKEDQTTLGPDSKKYIGFRGTDKANLESLPKSIYYKSTIKGWSKTCVFYLTEDNELTYCIDSEKQRDPIVHEINILSWDDFLKKVCYEFRKEKPSFQEYLRTDVLQLKFAFEGDPIIDKGIFPIGIDCSCVSKYALKHKGTYFYINDDRVLCETTNPDGLQLIPISKFLNYCFTVVGYSPDPELGKVNLAEAYVRECQAKAELEKIMVANSTVVYNPYKVFVIKTEEFGNIEKSLSLSERNPLKIIL